MAKATKKSLDLKTPKTKPTVSKSKQAQTPSKAKSLKPRRSPPLKKDTQSASVEAKLVNAEVLDPNDPGEEQFEDQEIAEEMNRQSFEFTDQTNEPPQLETSPKSSNLPAIRSKDLVSKDPLVTYLNEVRRYPLLTREQEVEIAKKYFDTKDPVAAQTLVQSNLRFVVKIAAEYSKFGSKMIDLIQEGNIGLMHAVREFNPYKGTRLITYAVWWIRGYIQEYLMRQYSMVRIGTTQNQRKLFYQLQKQKDQLDSVEFETNIEKISEKLGIPKDEVRDMAVRLSQRDVTLDKPIFEDSGTSFGDIQNDSSAVNLEEKIGREEEIKILKDKLEELKPDLNDREKILLEERILNEEPLTLQEIGEKYQITREAVRQAEVRLLKKIKSKMGLE